MTRAARGAAALLAVLAVLAGLTACAGDEPSSPPSTATPAASASASATIAPSASMQPTASAAPTPEPSLSLDMPDASDPRVVTVDVAPQVGDDSGTVTVTVTSTADVRIDELVLRWPTALNDSLFLAPFTPSEERIREGGPPLVQPWTKWVIGPGERGEPDGTISLGWGPLLPGATLVIELEATRLVPGPVAFDLQVLAGNDLLTLDGGEPAELRIEVP